MMKKMLASQVLEKAVNCVEQCLLDGKYKFTPLSEACHEPCVDGNTRVNMAGAIMAKHFGVFSTASAEPKHFPHETHEKFAFLDRISQGELRGAVEALVGRPFPNLEEWLSISVRTERTFLIEMKIILRILKMEGA